MWKINGPGKLWEKWEIYGNVQGEEEAGWRDSDEARAIINDGDKKRVER